MTSHIKILGIKIRKTNPKHYLRRFISAIIEFLHIHIYSKFPLKNKRKKFFYYTSIYNFGDLLNFEIIQKLFNINPIKTNIKKADYIFIGSIADALITKKDKIINPKPLKVIGAGFIQEQAAPVERYSRNLEILALRGKLTKERFEKNLNTNLDNVILADPGILAPFLIDRSNVKKKYKLGIVPHFQDKDSGLLKKLKKNIKDSKVINIQQNAKNFIKEMAECEVIVASAMHALIVAAALDIPNQWISFSNSENNNTYKFKDFYSAFFDEPISAINLTKTEITSETVDKIKNSYTFPMEKLKEAQNRLLDVLNKEFQS